MNNEEHRYGICQYIVLLDIQAKLILSSTMWKGETRGPLQANEQQGRMAMKNDYGYIEDLKEMHWPAWIS
jgi:hypothetical protein